MLHMARQLGTRASGMISLQKLFADAATFQVVAVVSNADQL
jgi:hypothetical protein